MGLILGLAVTLLWMLEPRGPASAVVAAETAMMPPGGVWAVIASLLAALTLSALYVAAETSLELLRPLHVRHVKEKNGGQSERLQWLLDHRPNLVASCILGRQTMKLVIVFLGLLLAQHLAARGEDLASADVRPVSYGTILLYALAIVVPLGLLSLAIDLVPRSYAALHPQRMALRLHRFVAASRAVFGLPASVITWLATLVTSRFGARATFESQSLVEEEIKTIVEEAEETGEIEVDERELLHSVFEFTDTVAREIMTPRVDLDALPVESDPSEVIRVIEETGHSRIPLYEQTDDQIVGIVHAKDLLMAAATGGEVNLRKLMRPALFVPENKSLHELLREMRQGRTQMAIIQDEFGGTAGIVTIEDIVEELVGDIVDEYDIEEPSIQQLDGYYIVGGKTHVDDVNAVLGSDFESEEFDTVGGYVFGLFGRQPKLQDCIESAGWRFCVVDTDGRRILKLRLEPAPEGARSETDVAV